jgi:hypothetical protein
LRIGRPQEREDRAGIAWAGIAVSGAGAVGMVLGVVIR